MNVDRILGLAYYLDNLKEAENVDIGFNMNQYYTTCNSADEDTSGHGCGTAGCIAGHAIFYGNTPLAKKLKRDDHVMNYSIAEEAANYLEITNDQARKLFEPNHRYDKRYIIRNSNREITEEERDKNLFLMELYVELYGHVTPKDAALVLRNLVETGEVDWSPVVARVEKKLQRRAEDL